MQTIAGLPDVQSVFEVGPGGHFCAKNLRAIGYQYDTFDFDDTHSPTYIGNLAMFNIAGLEEKYDLTCAFQVLEHMPWDVFVKNIRKLATLSKKYVFISIPYSCKGFSVTLETHDGQFRKLLKQFRRYKPTNMPQRKYRQKYMDEYPWAVHYWELGRKGISIDTVRNALNECTLQIIEQFHSRNAFHYFFLCEKNRVAHYT